MTDQQRPDEDVEGHVGRYEDPEASEDDVEGHRRKFHLDDEVSGDDVEGHSPARRPL